MDSKPKILLLDSDDTLMEILVMKFSQENFDVVSVNTMRELHKDREASFSVLEQEKFDVIIVDVFIEYLYQVKNSDFGILEKIRKSKMNSDAKIILYTNDDNRDSIKKASLFGIASVIYKLGSSPTDVLKKVEEILD